ncbi:unnamed protein product [Laminaria digitata]
MTVISLRLWLLVSFSFFFLSNNNKNNNSSSDNNNNHDDDDVVRCHHLDHHHCGFYITASFTAVLTNLPSPCRHHCCYFIASTSTNTTIFDCHRQSPSSIAAIAATPTNIIFDHHL